MTQDALDVPPLPPNSRVHFHPFRRPMKKSPPKQRSASSNSGPVTDYSWEITTNMLRTEAEHLPSPTYLSSHPDVTDRTRAVLIDFLVSLHSRLKLTSETLFLTVSLLDRVLAAQAVPKPKVQLLGVTALMVASKYEEVKIPPAQDFVDATDGAYLKADLLEMERSALTALGFHVTTPTAFTFYTRAVSLVVEDATTLHLIQYILELGLMEYAVVEFRPSMVMAAAYFLAKRLRNRPVPWPEPLQKQFAYTEAQLKKCARVLFLAYQSAEKGVLQNVRKKYAAAQFGEVSKMRLSPPSV